MNFYKLLNFLIWLITGRMNDPNDPPGIPLQNRRGRRGSRAGTSSSSIRRQGHTRADSRGVSTDKRDSKIKFLESELEKAKRSAEGYHNDFNVCRQQHDELKRDFDAARETIQAQRLDITELTQSIVNSVHGASITTRDDDYFESEFAALAAAIHQWAFRSFRGKLSDLKHQDLSETVQDSLKDTVLSASPDSKTTVKEIEAAVAEVIRRYVFNPRLVLATREVPYDEQFGSLFNILGRSDLEKRKWHSQTIDMIFENGEQADHFNDNINDIENDLQNYLDILQGAGNEEQRRRTLRAIIEQAAKLQLEIFRQISLFKIYRIEAGAPFNPLIMEDRSGIVDKSEEGKGNFIVQMVLFPPVLRWGFDEDGNFSKDPVVVRKGVVFAMNSES